MLFSVDGMCVFCKIVAGEIPARRLYEDDDLLAFADLHPQAPVHVLVIPKQHISSHAEMTVDHAALFGKLMLQAAAIARDAGLAGGYRLVMNSGEDGGQTVGHVHLHLLGGRQMHWPPG